jgi:hypothetical protein
MSPPTGCPGETWSDLKQKLYAFKSIDGLTSISMSVCHSKRNADAVSIVRLEKRLIKKGSLACYHLQDEIFPQV